MHSLVLPLSGAVTTLHGHTGCKLKLPSLQSPSSPELHPASLIFACASLLVLQGAQPFPPVSQQTFYAICSSRAQMVCACTSSIGCIEVAGEERAFGIENKILSKLKESGLDIIFCCGLFPWAQKKKKKSLRLLFPASVCFLEIFHRAPRKICLVAALHDVF